MSDADAPAPALPDDDDLKSLRPSRLDLSLPVFSGDYDDAAALLSLLPVDEEEDRLLPLVLIFWRGAF